MFIVLKQTKSINTVPNNGSDPPPNEIEEMQALVQTLELDQPGTIGGRSI